MALSQHPPLTIRQEGTGVRVTTPRLDFLFPHSEAQNIRAAYDELAAKAQGHLAPRWKGLPAADIAPEAFHEIIQETTLHWMYFCALNDLPLQIGDAEWEHPQTRRIIQAAVQRNIRSASRAETQLCAHLIGLTEAEYVHWRKADDAFLDRM